MLFIDLEKAFDRVSHIYLMDALKPARLGKNMRLCIRASYTVRKTRCEEQLQ